MKEERKGFVEKKLSCRETSLPESSLLTKKIRNSLPEERGGRGRVLFCGRGKEMTAPLPHGGKDPKYVFRGRGNRGSSIFA